MPDIKITVKEKSLFEFLYSYHPDLKDMKDMKDRRSVDIGRFLTNEIYLVKNCGLHEGDFMSFELDSRETTSNRHLINTYIYSVVAYDDICVKLKLSEFKTAPVINKEQGLPMEDGSVNFIR